MVTHYGCYDCIAWTESPLIRWSDRLTMMLDSGACMVDSAAASTAVQECSWSMTPISRLLKPIVEGMHI